MIQLSTIQTNPMNKSGKTADKDGAPRTAAFEALFQLLGQQEQAKADTDSEQVLAQLPFLQQQNPLMGIIFEKTPLIQVPIEIQPEQPQVVTTPAGITTEKQSESAPTGKMPEPQPDAANILKRQIVEGEKHISQTFVQADEASSLIETVPSGKNSQAEAFTIITSPQITQSNHSSGQQVQMPTVRASHFDQEVTKFLQSSIHITGMDDGIEAAFTLAPKHLGKVDVKVTIHDGQVTAEFLTSTPLGKDLLETHVQTLRSALETQGLQVAKIDVSQAQTSTSGTSFMGAFSQKGDSSGRQQQQDSRKRNEQSIIQTQDEYREYGMETGWVSKINTTA
ncbi:MAG: flagellar hook-length control protein FliK [Neobacillus sp.]